MALIEKLESLRLKYEEIGQQLADPSVISDVQRFVKLNKEYKNLEPIVETGKEYKNALANLKSSKELLATEKDEDLCQMAKDEIDLLEEQIPQIEDKIRILMIPKDPEDDKNAILEIRAGTGGDEASIFAGDLFRMYSKFIEQKGWKLEVTSTTEGTSGNSSKCYRQRSIWNFKI
jgi:peptide chain release factor 1